MFPVGRKNVHEVCIDIDPVTQEDVTSDSGYLSLFEPRWALKHQVADILHDEFEWSKLMFIDADCTVTRELEPFFEGVEDLCVCRERGQVITKSQFNCFLTDEEMNSLEIEGINSGVFVITRDVSRDFFKKWAQAEDTVEKRRRCCTDQAAFNRVILDSDYKIRDIGESVSMPFHTDHSKISDLRSSITHWVGLSGPEKTRHSFGLLMQTYYFDHNLTLFNLLEN